MPRYAPERVSTVTLGMIFFGLVMAWIGFSPAERFPDYRARLAARAAAVIGVLLVISGAAARRFRRPWALWCALVALAAVLALSTSILIALLLAADFGDRLYLPALGMAGGFGGVMFWLKSEVREEFGLAPRYHD